MAKLSPLMEQFYTIKRQCEDAVLLFRMGDFYETFGDDAVIAARELNITLTSRQKDDKGNKIPLAGVPYHAIDSYLTKLVKAGYKVAICEQVEDPKKAKGLVKREIVRIITPGTIIEPSMLEEGANNFLAALIEVDGSVGLALVDVSTGEFLTTEITGPELDKKLAHELSRFRPAECIVPDSMKESIKNGDRAPPEPVEDSYFSLEEAHSILLDNFGPDGLFELENKPLCIRASGAILSYLHKTQLDGLDHITAIDVYSISDFMILDEVTLRNLEILRNIRDRSKKGTLLEFLDRTKTPMGSRMLRKWLQMPLLSQSEIKRRLEAVEELSRSALLRADLQKCLGGSGDLERITARMSCETASPKDMIALKGSLMRLPRICDLLSETQAAYLSGLGSELELGLLGGVVDLIERSIVDDPPTGVRDGGIIRDDFDQELDELRGGLRDGKGWISRLEISERERTGIKSLKVGYNNVFGYYIEVTKPNLSSVPAEYMRKQTLANAERFVTPELKEVESKVLSAQEKSTALELELYTKIRSEIAGHAKEIQDRAGALGELDVLLSLAIVAVDGDFVRPELSSTGEITIRDSRHPVLDKAMRGGFVPNDVNLNQTNSRFIMLTGPNMAGKSTYMRQIALTVILAQMGSFVPASFASLGIVDRIFTRVGAYDDLVAGQSTFMIEMTELANILGSATKRSLILLDEIGRGTSTFDGLSIAWAISEFLHSRIKGKAIFATHYHQLTQLGETLPGVVNYNMAVKEEGDSITFLRSVVPGATDKSYGIHVARLAGVPEEVIKRANEILRVIESEAVVEPMGVPKSRKRSTKYTQLIFFDEPSKEDPILEEIKALDMDAMTPIDALNKLAEYQRKLRGQKDAQDQNT
jgi:DNA mismatch repair protein MutS